MKHLALLSLFAAGCILPVSTGAPLPATTVGRGNVGGAFSAEAPTLDLIADNDDGATGSPSAVSYGAAPAAAMTFTLSYGIGDNTDLEVAGEGALYFFVLPMPTGGSIGLRQHLDVGDAFDLGIAARFGKVGSSASVELSDGTKEESSASATYGAFQAVIQTKRGFVRPLLSVNLMPARIKRDPSEEDPFRFSGLASSLTAGLMLVGGHVVFGPYVTATNFYSDRFDNSGWFVSGGIVFAIRPDRSRDREPVPPAYAPPAYGPPPYGPSGPSGPPGDPAGPLPPPPPPTPTTAPF